MNILLFAFLIGVISGLRTFTSLAAVSWAARAGWLHIGDTWLAFLGYAWTPYILTVIAVGEYVIDKLPQTPSRRDPSSFAARIVSGAVCGGAIGAHSQMLLSGLAAGIVGAVAGTLGGYDLRIRLTKMAGERDLPVAVIEDLIAIAGAVLVVFAVS